MDMNAAAAGWQRRRGGETGIETESPRENELTPVT